MRSGLLSTSYKFLPQLREDIAHEMCKNWLKKSRKCIVAATRPMSGHVGCYFGTLLPMYIGTNGPKTHVSMYRAHGGMRVPYIYFYFSLVFSLEICIMMIVRLDRMQSDVIDCSLTGKQEPNA